MNLALYAVLIGASMYLVATKGLARAFAWVYVPAILLVNFATSKQMPAIPNLATPTAVGYGCVLGLVLRPSELKKIRWIGLDTMMVLMVIPTFLSTLSTVDAWNAYRESMEVAFRWLLPYFFARISLQDADGRRQLLKALAICTVIIGMLAAWEARIEPNKTARILSKLQWDKTSNVEVMYRFGLARAIATAGQPIDLGNCGVLAGTMILVLIPATGMKWNRPVPLIGILGAGAMVFCCVSFTAWIAMFIAFVLYFTFSRPTLGKWIILPTLACEMAGMLLLSYHWLHKVIPDQRPEDPIEASAWIRVRIIQDAWTQCLTSGWFGYAKTLDVTKIGVGSVDNSYLLFIMTTGWFSLAMWAVFMFVVVGTGAIAMKHARTASERLPLAAAIGGTMAVFFAMYTVFFGFAYSILICIVWGFIGTMYQMLVKPRPATAAVPGGYAPQGFPVMMGGAR